MPCSKNELKHRQQVERPRIIQQITDARTHGDLSENAEYHAAKEMQSLNEGRIAELEDKLARAEVIDVSKLSGRHHQVRRDRDAGRRGHRGEEGVADRRRARGRRQEGQDLDHLAARARADRQEQGRAASRSSRRAAPRPTRSRRSSGAEAPRQPRFDFARFQPPLIPANAGIQKSLSDWIPLAR